MINYSLKAGIFAFFIFILLSCEKMPGTQIGTSKSTTTTTTSSTTTTTTGSGSGTGSSTTTSGTSSLGIGPVAVGALNTIIFQVNGTTYTWPSTSYIQGINSLQVLMSTKYSTLISGADLTYTNSLTFGYENSVAGTYPMDSFTLTMPGVNLQQSGNTKLYANITQESINVISTITNQAKGVVKGTFDGYVINVNSATRDSVRVSGSFNISQ